MATIAYDPSVDYMKLMQEAEQAGDTALAAQYEAQRNAKIADLNAAGTNKWNAQESYNYVPDGGTYTYNGNTYNNYNQWVAAQTGSTPERVAQLRQQANNNHSGVMAAAKQDKVNSMYEQYIQDRYNGWLRAQSSEGAYIKGIPFDVYMEMEGGLSEAQRLLQNGWDAKNNNISVTPLAAQTYADILQRLTGGNMGGGELSEAFKAVNNVPTATTWQDVASLYTNSMPVGSVGATGTIGDTSTSPTGTGSNTSGSTTSNQNAMIEALYKAQQDAALAELKAAYDQNVIDLDAAAQKIPGIYQDSRNRTAADAAVNARNFNQYAAVNGLNTGAAGQAQLAMANQLQSGLSDISKEEAAAMTELEMERLSLKTQYQNAAAQAIADGDLEKAKALYNEAVRMDELLISQAYQNAQLALQQKQLEQNAANTQFEQNLAIAKLLAGLGDTSGVYSALGLTAPVVNTSYTGGGDKNLNPVPTVNTGVIPTIESTLQTMKNNGAPTSEILAAIVDAKNNGLLSQSGYLSLYNKYRG